MQMVKQKPSDVDSYKMWQKVDTVYDRAMNAFIVDKASVVKSRAGRDSLLGLALDRADKNATTIFQNLTLFKKSNFFIILKHKIQLNYRPFY